MSQHGSAFVSFLRQHATRRWLAYLIVTAVVASVLRVMPEASVPSTSAAFVADLLGGRSAGDAQTAAHSGATPGWLREMMDDAAWREGASRYVEMVIEPQQSPWLRPPAGAAITSQVRELQDQLDAVAASRSFQAVAIEMPANLPAPEEDRHYRLLASVGERQRSLTADMPRQSVEPMLVGNGELSLQLISRGDGFLGGFATQVYAGPTQVSLADIGIGVSRTVRMGTVEDGAQQPVPVRLTGRPTDIEANSIGKQHSPRTIAVDMKQVTVVDEDVSLAALKASEYLHLQRGARFTAIVVLGSSDLRGHVWCEREDGGERIGAYAPTAPVFAAIVDSWSSLRMAVRTTELDGAIKVRIVALSAAEPPGKRLVLELLGRELTSWQADGLTLNSAQMGDAVAWLTQAFHVQFTAADAEAAQSPQTRALLLHLAEKNGSTP